jgi:transcriptional regulator with XRE-family HTH domain
MTHQEQSRTTSVKKQLFESFLDDEYREAFVSERVRSAIGLQIQAMRAQRDKMTQKQLGDMLGGKQQPWVSKLEDPEDGWLTVATLLDVAAAFKVDLEIKFRPFSSGLEALASPDPNYYVIPGFPQEKEAIEQSLSESQRASVSFYRPDELPRAADGGVTVYEVQSGGGASQLSRVVKKSGGQAQGGQVRLEGGRQQSVTTPAA